MATMNARLSAITTCQIAISWALQCGSTHGLAHRITRGVRLRRSWKYALPSLAFLLSAYAAAGSITITESAPFPSLAPFPCEIHFTSPNVAWIEEIVGNQIGIYNVAAGNVTNVPVPSPLAVPGGEAIGSDGGVWFTEVSENKIARLDPNTLQITEFNIPIPPPGALQAALNEIQGLLGAGRFPTGAAVSDAIETGPDNAMWFTEIGNNAIGRIDLATFAITSYPIPTPAAVPLIIHRGPGNTMVFPESGAGKVGTIDVYTRQFKEYVTPTPASVPQGVITAGDGTIWFTETAGQNIASINPTTGRVIEYPIGRLSNLFLPRPGPLVFGNDGNLYVAEGNLDGGSNIGQFNPTTHVYTDYPLPTPLGSVCDLSRDSVIGNKIYFTEFVGQKIGVLTINP
jgi:virginiamycin B lyase